MSKLDYLNNQVDQLKKDGVYRTLPINYGPCSGVIDLNHKRVVNLSSNNYLGLANHPKVMEGAINAVKKYGAGTGSVRTIVGNQDLLEELEEVLADFKREEAVTCFQSGLNCNIGAIQAIVNKGDLIVSDALNHASIIDGVRLSRADKAVFKHSDMEDLERVLNERRRNYKNVLIITDGVFSMDGDLAKLPEIVKLAKKYECLTYVDDAHFPVENKDVVVLGCGPIGIMAVDVARAYNAKTVIGIEINEYRRNLALKLGADYVINPLEENVLEKVCEYTNGAGADVIGDFSGNKIAIETAFKYLKPGGGFAILGIPDEKLEIDVTNDIVFKGARIYGVTGRRIYDTWYQVKHLLDNNLLHLDKIITHRMPLSKITEAAEIMGSKNCGKIVLFPGDEINE